MPLRDVGMRNAGGAPQVGRGIVHFHDVGVARRGDHRGAYAPADHVDLAVHHAGRGMIARRGHGHARCPVVRLGIVDFVHVERAVRHGGPERNNLLPRMHRRAAEDINLAVDCRPQPPRCARSAWAPALSRNRSRDRIPRCCSSGICVGPPGSSCACPPNRYSLPLYAAIAA